MLLSLATGALAALASLQQVDIRNLFVLGPKPGERLAAGGSTPVYMSIVSNASAPDELVGIEAPGLAQSAEIANGALNLPPGKLISTNAPAMATPAAGTPTAGAPATRTKSAKTPAAGTSTPPRASNPARVTFSPAPSATPTPGQDMPTVILKSLAEDLVGGETVQLVLHFRQAGALTVNVPVVPREGYHSTYAPAPVPTPTPSATQPAPTGRSRGTTSTGTKPGKSKKKATPTPSA